ncbi:MAG: LruC domain-containing protein [Lunatimonas sp.]|uniref:LruC domain-containing protein n=1 Tax=Lunatimonas sp. TaxID=2060141 RepID=UPI00263AA250|nr:LruC domain-containing protein [Lunatimonas sp.]MCC5937828.1 LruC domain-containing protein [Lunatimonas sp.]
MKKITYIILGLVFGLQSAYGQNTLENNAEAGNRDIYAAQCWAFGSVTVSNTASTLISGSFSFRTNQVTSDLNTSTWIKTPWIQPLSGNITFNARLDGTQGGNRSILIQYIPYDESSANGEGTEVLFHQYDFPNPITNQTVGREISAAIPSAIVGKPHKIFISFVGTGGTARVGLDDLVIPGTYFSDPSNGCTVESAVKDTDGDGVADAEDAYPEDPYRAFDNPFPAKGFSTLMFEDLWPALGDYDFNDLVVDYRINRVTDAKGEIVEVIAELKTRAAGAGYRNGFGIEFTGVAPSKVISVEGTKIKGGSIHQFESNGLESNTRFVTVIAFDDVHNVLPHLGQGTTGVNTTPGGPFQEVTLQRVVITFKKDGVAGPGGAAKLTDITHATFNPFLIANQRRGYEIHLPFKPATNLADQSLFGTIDDNAMVGARARSNYRSKNGNLPWALDIAENIPYLQEGNNFTRGYLKFTEWVKSGGTMYEDWYLDKPGYRNGETLLNIK